MVPTSLWKEIELPVPPVGALLLAAHAWLAKYSSSGIYPVSYVAVHRNGLLHITTTTGHTGSFDDIIHQSKCFKFAGFYKDYIQVAHWQSINSQ